MKHMRTTISLIVGTVAALMVAGALLPPSPYAAFPRAQAEAPELAYLNPIAIKFSPDGRRLYVVCQGGDSLLAVDPATRRVVAQAKVGHKPRSIAVSPDGKSLFVSNEWSDTVSEIDAVSFQVRRTLKTGWGPVGLTTDRTGKALYVANSIGNNVSVIDLASGKENRRLMTERFPHYVALSRDGRRVYVSNLLPHVGPYDQPPLSELLAIDTDKQAVAERIMISGVIELRHIAEAPAALGSYLIVPFLRPKNLGPLIRVGQGWVLTHGMAVLRPAPVGRPGGFRTKAAQVLLDDIDRYYAGNCDVAFTPSGQYALVTASEASIVSIIDTARLSVRLRQVPAEELPDRLDSARTFVVRRLPTGREPCSIAVSPDGRVAYIANRLDDTLTNIDLRQLKVTETIDLGGPKQITQLRRGERLFHDASYCFQGQFACSTCHPMIHVDGLAWNLETPQLGRDRVDNRTLRGIKDTAPFKWIGHNPDLQTQCGPRIAKFLFRSEGFNPEELEDLVAFINSIPLPRNRHLAPNGELTTAQERGKQMFFRETTTEGKEIPIGNRCYICHPPEAHYTMLSGADVGSADKYDTLKTFDVPQLDRVYESAPYLHNGEALGLEEIWTIFNNDDTHGVTSDMRKEQLNDLIEFLKTL
jgi:YVTN family beta-propeller protein